MSNYSLSDVMAVQTVAAASYITQCQDNDSGGGGDGTTTTPLLHNGGIVTQGPPAAVPRSAFLVSQGAARVL